MSVCQGLLTLLIVLREQPDFGAVRLEILRIGRFDPGSHWRGFSLWEISGRLTPQSIRGALPH